jgi:hypothetical protein
MRQNVEVYICFYDIENEKPIHNTFKKDQYWFMRGLK